jgi:hypothetical protein
MTRLPGVAIDGSLLYAPEYGNERLGNRLLERCRREPSEQWNYLKAAVIDYLSVPPPQVTLTRATWGEYRAASSCAGCGVTCGQIYHTLPRPVAGRPLLLHRPALRFDTVTLLSIP